MSELLELALVFARIGLLAFGGSSAILPELQRAVVGEHAWLTEREFIDGFALGQLTPGPGLLMVMFVGYRVAGLPGALVALAAIVTPAALLSALVTARWDDLKRLRWLTAFREGFAAVALGLAAAGSYTILTAAVTDVASAAIALVAAAGLWRWRLHPTLVIVAGGVAGVLVELLRGWTG